MIQTHPDMNGIPIHAPGGAGRGDDLRIDAPRRSATHG